MSDVQTFELREHVDGKWACPEKTLEPWLCDPNEGKRLVQMRASSLESLERALTTAKRVHRAGVWGDRPAALRAQCLRAIAAELEKRCEAMAQLDSLASGVV